MDYANYAGFRGFVTHNPVAAFLNKCSVDWISWPLILHHNLKTKDHGNNKKNIYS